MATRGKNRDDRVARERARVYAARRDLHAGQSRRRTRDNVIAAVAGGVLILGVIGAQALYFTSGPGAPAPSPTQSTNPTPSATESPTDPTPSPTP